MLRSHQGSAQMATLWSAHEYLPVNPTQFIGPGSRTDL